MIVSKSSNNNSGKSSSKNRSKSYVNSASVPARRFVRNQSQPDHQPSLRFAWPASLLVVLVVSQSVSWSVAKFSTSFQSCTLRS